MTRSGQTLNVTVQVKRAGSAHAADPWVTWPFVSGVLTEDADSVPRVTGSLVCTAPNGVDLADPTWSDVTGMLYVKITVAWGAETGATWQVLARSSVVDMIAGTVSLNLASNDLILLRPLTGTQDTYNGTAGEDLERVRISCADDLVPGVVYPVPNPPLFADGHSFSPPSTWVDYLEFMTQQVGMFFQANRDGTWTLVPRTGSQSPTVTLMTGHATFADFDAAYAGKTFANFDAAYAGKTFADFDASLPVTEGSVKTASFSSELDGYVNAVSVLFAHTLDATDDAPRAQPYVYPGTGPGSWTIATDDPGVWTEVVAGLDFEDWSNPATFPRALAILAPLQRVAGTLEVDAVLDTAVTAGTWVRFLIRRNQLDRQVRQVSYDLAAASMHLTARIPTPEGV